MSRDEADSRADAELKKQASALGLADGEVVGLLLGKLCIINASKNEVRALTPEQYSKFCEMSGACTLANESKKEESKPAKKQHTREEIMLVEPNDEEKELLALEEDEEILLIKGIAYKENDRPLEYYEISSDTYFYRYRSLSCYNG